MTRTTKARWATAMAYSAGFAILLSGLAEAKGMVAAGASAVMGVIVLLGGGIAGYGYWLSRQAQRAGAWPQADGTMLESHVEEQRNRKSGTIYYLRVSYRYDVAGQSYAGTNFRVGIDDIRRAEIETLTQTYRAGSSVKVFYNPAKPKESVLEIGPSRAWIFYLIGGVIIAFGVGLIAFMLATAK